MGKNMTYFTEARTPGLKQTRPYPLLYQHLTALSISRVPDSVLTSNSYLLLLMAFKYQ